MPKGEIYVDPTESYADQSATGSVADSASTNMKATVAQLFDDQQYVYKKLDNYVVLQIKIQLKTDFNLGSSEMHFGFQMKTTSLRFGQDSFSLTTPIFINLGKVKMAQPPPSSGAS